MVAFPVTFPIKTLNLSPGSHALIEQVSWEDYEALLEELGGDRRIPRINYCHETLELMSPLPAHERPHRIIAYIVTAILDAQNRDWEDFGSTTFKKPKKAGLEPDTCFYIENALQVRSLLRMDMAIDPPPDLAIESDVTSKTTMDAYQVIGVPEVWIYDNNRLNIHLLQQEGYVETANSLIFPDINVVQIIPKLVQKAFDQGTSQMLREFRLSLSKDS
ncbi:Uma2 family endonuclease [Crocosphaera sp. UHCC 0190]|uniref:Uma2 family endonuclease n=1 Tax=Crocosphaera sp. UHCC 0190 TaxID=3110246 RepID=UPI002B2020B3|nr:Uma2 family endonuclease [Crocosphaera sp. UHCC 0190]MEA5508509.1 Uma2 family endonuclease [Crocosphaera sp. UHCC 0190]